MQIGQFLILSVRILVFPELHRMNTSAQAHYLLFDLGNVIVDLDIPATYTALTELTNLNREAFNTFLNETAWLEKYETGQMDTDAFIDGIIRYARPGSTSKDVINSWNAMLVDIPYPRLEWLASLRPQFQVGLLSNTNPLHLEWVYQFLLKRYGITDFESRYFDQVFYSHQIGHRKPDRSCFDFALEKIGLPAANILFIDDLAENTSAARLTGMRVATHSPASEIMERMDQYLFI